MAKIRKINKSAEEIQNEIFRRMPPTKKLHLAGEFYQFARKFFQNNYRSNDRTRKTSYKSRYST